ncbi:MAG: hypothetical protein AAF638_09870 [Pseudomonadota bacterium]
MTEAIAAIAPSGSAVSQPGASQLSDAAVTPSVQLSQASGSGLATSGSSTASMQSTTSVRATEMTLADARASSSQGIGPDVGDVLSGVHSDVSKMDEAKRGATDPFNSDSVAQAKEALSSSSWSVSETGAIEPAKNGAFDKMSGTERLQNSFDHAIFLTMVSQVVGGISTTTNNLIRQQ